MKIKLRTYCLATFATTLASFAYFFYTNTTIYETLGYMAESDFATVVFSNFIFMVALLLVVFIKNVFFGQLSNEEIDSIIEQSKWSFINSFLIITMFTDQISFQIITFTGFLLFVKIFHWIVSIRINAVRELCVWTSIKMVFFILLLMAVDAYSMYYFSMGIIGGTFEKSLFTISLFEFTVLIVSAISFLSKYAINLTDAYYDNRWNRKPYLSFAHKISFLTFLFIFHFMFMLDITFNYGLPVYLLRDMYVMISQLRSTISKYRTYVKLINAMNQKFPDVPARDLDESDRICVICREEMVIGKRLPCRHVFHFDCLQTWFQQQGACPTCRAVVRVDRNAARPPRSTPGPFGGTPAETPAPTRPTGGEDFVPTGNRPPAAFSAHAQAQPRSTPDPSENGENGTGKKTDGEVVGGPNGRKREKGPAEMAAEAVERAMGRGVRALEGVGAAAGTVPRHLFEAQTVLLNEHVLAVSEHLERMQRLLRAQLELQHEINCESEQTDPFPENRETGNKL